MKKISFLYLLLPLLALILEILPFGAVLNFANVADDGTIGYVRETYSYFSLMPVGYANIFPFSTAIFTCIVFALIVAYCITKKALFCCSCKNITVRLHNFFNRSCYIWNKVSFCYRCCYYFTFDS